MVSARVFWIAALLLCLVEPVSAKEDDGAICDNFAKVVGLFDTEKKQIFAEYEGATKTNSRKANGLPRENPVACRALRKVENATFVFVQIDDEFDGCFGSGKDAFLKYMKQIYDSTAILEASYCSKQELRKPIEETKTEKCFYRRICD